MKGKIAVECAFSLLPSDFIVAVCVIDVFDVLQNRLTIETGNIVADSVYFAMVVPAELEMVEPDLYLRFKPMNVAEGCISLKMDNFVIESVGAGKQFQQKLRAPSVADSES